MLQPIRLSFNIDGKGSDNKETITEEYPNKSEDKYHTPNNYSTIDNIDTSFSPVKNKRNLEPNESYEKFKTREKTSLQLLDYCNQSKSYDETYNDGNKTKPSMTSIESRNKLYDYSHSKKYYEDMIDFTLPTDNDDESSHNDEDDNERRIKKDPLYAQLIECQRILLPVPVEKADDEKFKILTMQKLKKNLFPKNKSAKMETDMSPFYQKKFDSAIEFSLMKKRKIVHSTEKKYMKSFVLSSNDNKEVQFPLFIDKQIGIYEYWQENIIKSKADEDIETDEEQLMISATYIISELKEAIYFIKEKGVDIIQNTLYITKTDTSNK